MSNDTSLDQTHDDIEAALAADWQPDDVDLTPLPPAPPRPALSFYGPNIHEATDPADLRAFSEALFTLGHYASAKSNAVRFRRENETQKAQRWEAEADRLYAKLPDWAR